MSINRKIFLLIAALLSATFYCSGQDTIPKKDTANLFHSNWESSNNFSLVTGYELRKYSYAEIGFAHNGWFFGFDAVGAWAYYLTSEIRLSHNMSTLIAPKIGGYVSGMGITLGANALCYTDFTNSLPVFRPEVGFSAYTFKIAYGYNIPLTRRDFANVKGSLLSITLMWKLVGMEKETVRN